MLKRRAAPSKTARKRKKGGTTYAVSSLDPPDDDKVVVEAISIWDISTSGRTGRLSARRRTVEHHHETLERPGNPSTSKGSEGGKEDIVEDAGTLADSEFHPEIPKNRKKKKRVRVTKENDSVSEPPVLRVVDAQSVL